MEPKTKILIINGAPRSGKDTFINFISQSGFMVYVYSSIDWAKEKAVLLGWDGKKDARGRKFLSDIKSAATEYADIPFNQIIMHLKIAVESQLDFFAVNIREPKEISKLASYCEGFNLPCYTIRVVNQKAEDEAKSLNNHADTNYKDYPYSHIIENNSTFEALRAAVGDFLSVGRGK